MRKTIILEISRMLAALLLLLPASATGIPALDLGQLISSADLIVVGTVHTTGQIGNTTIDLSGQQIPATLMAGEVRPGIVLKGDVKSNAVPFRFAVPQNPAGGIGYADIENNSYRILFLRRSEGNYAPANPYYPSLPAAPRASASGSTPFDRVISELASAIQSAQVPTSDRVNLLINLQKFDTPPLHEALLKSLASTDRVLQLSVAAALLRRNDIAALGIAEQALLLPPADTPAYVLQNLSSAIAKGMRDPRAVPALDQILRHAPDVQARRSAAFALRNTGSLSATRPLAHALGDPDLEVRYYAVIGLAEITGDREWRPLLQDYQSQEQHYLSHWQEWAANQQH
jgi:hypothetical protein